MRVCRPDQDLEQFRARTARSASTHRLSYTFGHLCPGELDLRKEQVALSCAAVTHRTAVAANGATQSKRNRKTWLNV